jgi:pyruvate formate lyase activating enzyme
VLRVGGLTRLSAADYPGKLAAVVYCQGCAWRCGYCHNPELQPARGAHEIPWAEVVSFLDRRRGLLDAVVFSGGEPTLQPSLRQAMGEVKGMGYLIGLHTAGIVPRRLAEVLPLLDWVGMDVKAPFEEHERVSGKRGSASRARASRELIRASGVACEFHTVAADSVSSFALVADRVDKHPIARLVVGVKRQVPGSSA